MTDKDKIDEMKLDDESDVVAAGHFGPQTAPLASTPVDLARLGLNEVAYIRRATVDNVPMWTIHSATGVPIGAAHNLEQAWGAVKQHDLEPVHVH